MKNAKSFDNNTKLAAMNIQTSGIGRAAPWVRSSATGLVSMGTNAFGGSTVVWCNHNPQPFTVIWGCAGIFATKANNVVIRSKIAAQ
jgi:hypothetical protein